MKKQAWYVVLAVSLAPLGIPTAYAETTTTTAVATGGSDVGSCPVVHTIAVHSAGDSAGGAGQADTGLLGEVISPVITAANSKDSGDKTGGFTPEVTTPAPSTTASSTPNHLGVQGETFAPLGGKPSSSTHASGIETFAPLGSNPTTSASAPSTAKESSARSSLSTRSKDGVATVKDSPTTTRTYIGVTTTGDQAYLPWVHDQEPATYSGQIDQAAEKVQSVLDEIHSSCPNTKVVLMGTAQGAQVASHIAKEIGHGNNKFPSSQLAGVALFSDPTRGKDQKAAGANTGVSVEEKTQAHGQGVVTATNNKSETVSDFGDVSDRTVSWCLEGDSTCGMDNKAPLAKLVASANKNLSGDPAASLHYISSTLAPAVALGAAETLAEDLQFGPDGFSVAKAGSPDKTLIGRISSNATTQTGVDRQPDRLVAAASKLGGMGLAAGITVATKTLTPANIAQIAAAGAIAPEAGALVAAAKVGEASLELIGPKTASTAAMRVFDEAEAAGLETDDMTKAAIESAVSDSVSTAAYKTRPVTTSGQTATGATTSWLANIVAGQVQGQSPELTQLASGHTTAVSTYDAGAVDTALKTVMG
ncbi:cutinase family protein [Corynebacterium sp. 3HC-13]|uniref:cutinase family protein n=1 Tax=Corynebacterium poyangense TaxID=2684405 RepID=UPI001CCAE08C|nr:cutinase family protein [Corynebacterium poyangense]MBZ8176222.1 cutinase family protein [Corynebacterium poyangense]